MQWASHEETVTSWRCVGPLDARVELAEEAVAKRSEKDRTCLASAVDEGREATRKNVAFCFAGSAREHFPVQLETETAERSANDRTDWVIDVSTWRRPVEQGRR